LLTLNDFYLSVPCAAHKNPKAADCKKYLRARLKDEMFKNPLFSAKVFEAKYVTRPGGDLALQQGEFNHSYHRLDKNNGNGAAANAVSTATALQVHEELEQELEWTRDAWQCEPQACFLSFTFLTFLTII
jgi:hypothetical protein